MTGTLSGANRSQSLFASAGAILGVLMLAGALASPASAEESANWFVVRQHTTGACWTAKLIKVDGEYVHANQQTAGGPYADHEQAQTRKAELEREGACTQ